MEAECRQAVVDELLLLAGNVVQDGYSVYIDGTSRQITILDDAGLVATGQFLQVPQDCLTVSSFDDFLNDTRG